MIFYQSLLVMSSFIVYRVMINAYIFALKSLISTVKQLRQKIVVFYLF